MDYAHWQRELFEGQIPLSHLRALCSLYPEAVQIVARKSAKIKAVTDLRGKRVNIGPSGSGKSTLLRVMISLATPHSSTLRFDGRPLAPPDFPALRRKLGSDQLTVLGPAPAVFPRLNDRFRFQILLKGMGGFGDRITDIMQDMIRGFEEREY